MNKTQKGFAIVETLLILIVIAVIGGVGWYALHTKNQTDKILSQADKISQSTPITTKKSPSSTQSQTTRSTGSNTVLSADNKVQLTLPAGWKVSSRVDGGQKCGFATAGSGATDCVSDISFQDGTDKLDSYVKIFKSNMNPGEWYSNVLGDCNDEKDITINGNPGVTCTTNTDKSTIENVVSNGTYVAYFYGPDIASESSLVRSIQFL